jgi:hypothetical protein
LAIVVDWAEEGREEKRRAITKKPRSRSLRFDMGKGIRVKKYLAPALALHAHYKLTVCVLIERTAARQACLNGV